MSVLFGNPHSLAARNKDLNALANGSNFAILSRAQCSSPMRKQQAKYACNRRQPLAEQFNILAA
ncbi:hypothetical protein [Microvirga terricola]|uniref:Uncharacterized protein n=1 Tax=Microvirga terricola TaxID=2719797 RepID=A0ABX0V7W7_9HYPH|nr:hypothetical protein [Microvirga terricola]NIX75954.1 hypothetical protein [Microvirga terricola]